MFEFTFRDERYLPFEGAGAISDWTISLAKDKELNQFDYSSISDVILHINFTARTGKRNESSAIDNVKKHFSDSINSESYRMIDLKRKNPTNWQLMNNPTLNTTASELEIVLDENTFLYRDQLHQLKVNRIHVFAKGDATKTYSINLNDTKFITLIKNVQLRDLLSTVIELPSPNELFIDPKSKTIWNLKIKKENDKLRLGDLDELYLILQYSWIS